MEKKEVTATFVAVMPYLFYVVIFPCYFSHLYCHHWLATHQPFRPVLCYTRSAYTTIGYSLRYYMQVRHGMLLQRYAGMLIYFIGRARQYRRSAEFTPQF